VEKAKPAAKVRLVLLQAQFVVAQLTIVLAASSAVRMEGVVGVVLHAVGRTMTNAVPIREMESKQ
jgi:hypothetical protein